MWRCGWLDGGARGEVGDEAGGEGRLGGGEVEEVEFGRLEDEIEMKEEVGTVFTLGSTPVTPMCDPVWFEDSHHLLCIETCQEANERGRRACPR